MSKKRPVLELKHSDSGHRSYNLNGYDINQCGYIHNVLLHVSESEMAKIRPDSVRKIIIFQLEHSKKKGAENLSLSLKSSKQWKTKQKKMSQELLK